MNSKHMVRTFVNNKMVYEFGFVTAEDAYKEFCDICKNHKEYGIPGHKLTIVRYVDERIMAIEEVVA